MKLDQVNMRGKWKTQEKDDDFLYQGMKNEI